jgi:dTDP-4-dehydrorhamnose 3,5-epimerase
VRFEETPLAGAWFVDLELHEDDRGFFARTWCVDEVAAQGLETTIAQWSISFNTGRGTLRGMHWQEPPHAETKLVRCVRGAIYDVIVDLRPDSPTYRRWLGAELDEVNRRSLYIPEGFAHGFQTLSEGAEVLYGISERYAPESARGFRWDDPAVGIEWPPAAGERVISERDLSWPDLDAATR